MNGEKELREIQALMRLIDEPDYDIFLEISRKIHSFGPGIIPFLENEWEKNHDIAVQDRIETLIHQIHFDHIKDEFGKWVAGGCRDLLQACIIIARYQYPQLHEEDIHNNIGRIRKDIWLEMNENLTALEQIKVFNHIFYDIHGFNGNRKNYHDPANSFINKVLETRTGNPLSLSVVYMIIAQSLDIPVFGINLPEHFVLAYTTSGPDPEGTEPAIRQQVLFYINAFSGGAVFSYQEVSDFVARMGHEPVSVFFNPCSNEDIVRRMLNNLVNAFTREGQADKAGEMEMLRDILNSPATPL